MIETITLPERLRPMGPVRECLFCEHQGDEASLAEHVPFFHRERLAAAKAYQQALAVGASLDAARSAYNEALYAALEGGPGRYSRRRMDT